MSAWTTEQQGQWLQTWVTEGQNMSQWLQTWVTEGQNNSQWLQTWVTEGQNNRVNDYRHEWLIDTTTGSMTTDMSDWGTEHQSQWLQTRVTEWQNNRVNDIWVSMEKYGEVRKYQQSILWYIAATMRKLLSKYTEVVFNVLGVCKTPIKLPTMVHEQLTKSDVAFSFVT